MVLPLRVWTNESMGESASLAHTLDISPIGGRLGGLRAPVAPGQTITLQRGQRKAQFRVVWSRQLAPAEVQAGIEVVDETRNIWDVELPQARGQQPRPQPRAVREQGPEVRGEHQEAEGPPVASKATDELPEQASNSAVKAATHRARHDSSHSRMRWIAACGMLLFICLLGLIVRYEVFKDAKVAPPQIPVVGTPTAEELAAMTPKPIKLVPLAATDAGASRRLQVAEAPKGRVEYPVSPEADVKGKVNLKVVIAADGRVKQVLLVSGQQLLASAAEQAVRMWRYNEHQRNGAPVEAETSVTVSFLGKDAVSLRFPSENRIVAN